jgi:thiol-disulfide isomerase/thioredoxin
MKRILAAFLTIAMVLICIPVFAYEVSPKAIDEPERDPHGIGADLSAVNAPYLLQGGTLSTTDFLTIDDISSHTITVINFWSQSCPYCLPEMPYFQYVHDTYPDVLVVGCGSTLISGSQSGEANYFFGHGYTYMSVFQDTVLRNYHLSNGYLPQTIIVDSNGIVIDLIEGATTQAALEAKVLKWLGYYSDTYYDVSFVCGVTGEVFATQSVHAGYQPTYPSSSEVPQVEGYSFSGWSPSTPPYVIGPTTITANYIPSNFFVKFYDSIDGTLIKTKTVPYGSPVEPPTPPVHPGYVFVGWDHDLSCITENLNVYTIYEGGGAGGDVDGDGEVTAADALIALRASMDMQELTPEQIEQADVDVDGDITAADALLILRMSMGIN